jgi:hypothetical protein
MEMYIIEKQVLDELTDRLDTLKSKLDSLYAKSGVAPVKWLDNQQACIYLSASKRTLQNLRDSGILPFTKMGAKVYYKPADIENMLMLGYKRDV